MKAPLLFIFLCLSLLQRMHAQVLPVDFSAGEWFKLGIEKEGVYKITHDNLRRLGIDPGKVDPGKINIYGMAGGMLPQANNALPSFIGATAIMIVGEDDGSFDRNDYILFYAQGPHRFSYSLTQESYTHETNVYSDKAFYFLTTTDDQPAVRVTDVESLPGNHPVINTFDDYVFHELEEYNELRSGREWFGERFGLTTEYTFSFSLPGIVGGSNVKVISDVLSQSLAPTSMKLLLNNATIGEQPLPTVRNALYAIAGVHRRDTLLFNETAINGSAQTDHQLKYQFQRGTAFSQAFLDFFIINFERSLQLYGKQTFFLSARSTNNPTSAFEISGVPDQGMVWNVTNAGNVSNQVLNRFGNRVSFSANSSVLQKFVVFTPEVDEPELIGKVATRNIKDLPTPDALIVTHESLRSEAERLAQHRAEWNNVYVHVVTVEEVYNQFSSGRQDVSAIRNFVRALSARSPGRLKSLLLFGKASYDYRDRFKGNVNLVATYESRNSLDPLQSYASDDFFGFLEEGEGEWRESPAQNHTVDIGVGRLPVKTLEEAKNIVDKIIAYDKEFRQFGAWRKEIVFVADDGNTDDNYNRIHQFDANRLATFVDDESQGFDTKRLFMGTYPKVIRGNGESVPKLTDDIVRAFERGALIINYTGHGSEKVWADEQVMSDAVIDKLDNRVYPFLITASCAFGRNDDPFQTSNAERCIVRRNGGAIGLVSTTRDVFASSNFQLNDAFYEALFTQEQNQYFNLGEVFRRTKNNSINGVLNRNFALLADPSMFLGLPPNKIEVTSITTASGSDVVKALSTVTLRGEIRNSNENLINNFNGVVDVTLFDKKSTITTSGRNTPPFSFDQWSNIIFRGKASAREGKFEISFIVPKNIAYKVDQGRISLYAFDETHRQEAQGALEEFQIGGSEDVMIEDTNGPEIALFLGDTTFIDGGVTSPNTMLVARLRDEQGINISGYGIGNSLIAILDEDTDTFILNDYYSAGIDSYQEGWVYYPIKNLPAGRHTLTLKAWDVLNNSSTATIAFYVSGEGDLLIESFSNYPNPFSDRSTLFFTHNRSGDDLQAQVLIYSLTGELIVSQWIDVSQSEYKVNLLEFTTDQSGKKLPAGLYLAHLVVRSVSNGAKNERSTKLIVVN